MIPAFKRWKWIGLPLCKLLEIQLIMSPLKCEIQFDYDIHTFLKQVPIRAWKLKEEDKLQGNVFGMLIVERFKGFRMQKFPYLNNSQI